MPRSRRRSGLLFAGAVVLGAAVFAAVVYAHDRRPVAVFLGDSYTAGAGTSDPGRAAPYLIAQRYGWRPVMLARNATGYITPADPGQFWCGLDHCPSYTESIPAAAAANPDVVIVNGGRNELWIAGSPEWSSGVDKFFAELRRSLPYSTIIATSPIWDDDPTPPELETMGEVVRRAVSAVGGTYVDIGEPLLGRPDLVADDGIHPNDAGNAAIAAAFEAAHASSGAPPVAEVAGFGRRNHIVSPL